MESSAARLDAAARELYGLPPEAFVAARKRLADAARADGDRELSGRIGALRRPTVSAWAVNRLARANGGDLNRLLDTGSDLRTAWTSGGDLANLGELEERRSALIVLLVRAAKDLAAADGRPLRDPAVREVEQTLQAATVDEDVAEEIRAGRLDRPRSHSGFIAAVLSGGDGTDPRRPGAGRPGPDTARTMDRGRTTRAGRSPVRPVGPAERARPPDRTEQPAHPGKPAPFVRPVRSVRSVRSVPAEQTEQPVPAEPAEQLRQEAREQREQKARRAAEAEASLTEWESRCQAAEQELSAIDDETRRLRAALDELAGRRKGVERRARIARREHGQAVRRAEKARRRADEPD